MDELPFALDKHHASSCHDRWIKRRNNLTIANEHSELPDDWYNEQCGQCRYFVPLRGTGAFGSDWGVCSNPTSQFDGYAMFEHDGCDHYLGAGAWVSEYFPPCPEQDAS